MLIQTRVTKKTDVSLIRDKPDKLMVRHPKETSRKSTFFSKKIKISQIMHKGATKPQLEDF